jgi:hypothetical protein
VARGDRYPQPIGQHLQIDFPVTQALEEQEFVSYIDAVCELQSAMPVEIIGDVGTPGADPEWISAQATL